jgi:hypothetical protein
MATSKFEQPRRPVTRESIVLWVIHRFAAEFGQHAVLRGGMALRLLDSTRYTNDIDYVFVPFESKKEVAPYLKKILDNLEDATIEMKINSKIVCFDIRLDNVAIQVEATVALKCGSTPIASASLAIPQGEHSRIVNIMPPDAALAHKLAAWNERRLLRDLYDAYFLFSRVGVTPCRDILIARLGRVQSRIPVLRKRKSMSLENFLSEFDLFLKELSDFRLQQEMEGLLDVIELTGLAARMRVSLSKLSQGLALQLRDA